MRSRIRSSSFARTGASVRWAHSIRRAAGAIAAVACVAATLAAFAADEKSLKKPDFEKALAQPVVAQVDDAELRAFVVSLAKDRHIPLVFDRRIDASLPIAWKFEGEAFLPAVDRRAGEIGAAARTVGMTLYLGPKEPASKLRTLIALRQEELKKMSRWPAQKRVGAQGRRHIDWSDAEDPRELLKRISQRWGLPAPEAREIPRDLWPEGAMNGVDAAEALSLVLIQFDWTFAWTEGSAGIEIVPIPDRVEIERRHKVPRGRAAGLMEELAALVPDTERSLEGDVLVVRGLIEDQKAIEFLLSPRIDDGSRKPRPDDPIPLSERRFTVTAEQLAIKDAIKAVEAYGITIEFDEDALSEANVDLDRRIDLKLQKATIDQLLRAICSPVDLRYEIDGLKVTLSPRRARGESPPRK
jgi:hypothetical protein